ncbi:Hypothetical Protein FCC1311_066562 [Hondaea fermentalgiana]|uniref:Uncharacterized protein n=1 Tax=Hondaea fermentalgiana TaxID=2315210 RepID=A0A2R5GHR6_9STRA|nr:Hypothetical Protein FCC1311_066562 [Hondaea fermentalgiana]|eukprot:GBG30437.1 Hypothetical Protein FCC1311_066562 [Hondaea fermentalgiana]
MQVIEAQIEETVSTFMEMNPTADRDAMVWPSLHDAIRDRLAEIYGGQVEFTFPSGGRADVLCPDLCDLVWTMARLPQSRVDEVL